MGSYLHPGSIAIHLEVASHLDTSSCINALRRFMCRRGPVKSIRTDNGSTERAQGGSERIGPCKDPNELLKDEAKWTFNPPFGAHHGGVWERFIRLIKKILYSVLKEQTLDDKTLQTALCEVEAIMNDRPITTASNDPNDLESLTPNHLLQLNLSSHQDFSRKETSTHEGDGGKYNILLTSSGRDGCENMYLSCNQEANGIEQSETSVPMMWLSS